MDFAILKAELSKPAYTGKTDQQAADILNALTVSVPRSSITAAELWENTALAEYAALTQAQRDAYQVLVSLGAIDVTAGNNSKITLGVLFAAGTTTRANLLALVAKSLVKSRFEVLGLGEVTAGDVERARAGAY